MTARARIKSFVESHNSENRVIFVPITSRQVGFSVAHSFSILTRNFGTVFPGEDALYSIVRASYAAFEAALMAASPNGGHTRGDIMFEKYKFDPFLSKIFDNTPRLPFILGNLVNAMGAFDFDDCDYKIVMAPTVFMENGRPMPFPETIRFRNLRDTVVALNDPETPDDVRENFRRYCPLPGAIWAGPEDDPILMNPNDFMPPGYNVHVDLPKDLRCLDQMVNKFAQSHLRRQPVVAKFEGLGQRSLLVSNNIADMRCHNRGQRERLEEYYQRLVRMGPLEGGHSGYYGYHSDLDDYDLFWGAVNLLGECPDFFPEREIHYAFRSEGLSSWGEPLDYTESMQMVLNL